MLKEQNMVEKDVKVSYNRKCNWDFSSAFKIEGPFRATSNSAYSLEQGWETCGLQATCGLPSHKVQLLHDQQTFV